VFDTCLPVTVYRSEVRPGPNELSYCNKDGVIPIHTTPKGPCRFSRLCTSLRETNWIMVKFMPVARTEETPSSLCATWHFIPNKGGPGIGASTAMR